ncbi:hypothetical protein GTY83_07070 [Streptomyces sp. SID4928]|nr:hypothetical protein [Streptomyces sp. SID4928]
MSNYSLGNLFARDLLAEVDRLRAEMYRWRERTEEAETSEAQLKGRVRGLRAQVDELEEQGRFLERNTLPDLNRQIEHHQGGKARWRKRAEAAEARVAELEAAGSRLAAVERLAEEADDKCNSTIDTDLLLDALGLNAAPIDEAVEMAEAEAELEVMRREHPAPCRVPDSPDCTCPDELSLPLCGKTVAVDGTVYAPCARHAGHSAAYCRDSARNHYFLTADLHGSTP